VAALRQPTMAFLTRWGPRLGGQGFSLQLDFPVGW
jgi:hypothetical protein